ncbi:MAG: hypothetical protein P8N23_02930 [Methylophilaceae bacterium]|nr:hypothetical protein [Methylophilaceae bacterium]MDG1453462.1 hypothetical protein [Methylophilaceae bacterium]
MIAAEVILNTTTNELLLDEEDQLYTKYMNIYDCLLATRDITSWDDSLLYQMEELNLEVDLELDVEVT